MRLQKENVPNVHWPTTLVWGGGKTHTPHPCLRACIFFLSACTEKRFLFYIDYCVFYLIYTFSFTSNGKFSPSGLISLEVQDPAARTRLFVLYTPLFVVTVTSSPGWMSSTFSASWSLPPFFLNIAYNV